MATNCSLLLSTLFLHSPPSSSSQFSNSTFFNLTSRSSPTSISLYPIRSKRYFRIFSKLPLNDNNNNNDALLLPPFSSVKPFFLLCTSIALSFSLFAASPLVESASAFVVATPRKLQTDELATVRLFQENTPSVVYITNLAVRQDAFTLDVLEVPQGSGSGFVWKNKVIASISVEEMVFLSWGRPSSEQQQQVINKTGTFNYDNKYRGASSRSVAKLEDSEIGKDGFLINHARVLVGSGRESYEKGKKALQNWKHIGMDWTFVDPATSVETGKKFCICVKEVVPWLMLPLQVVYVDESQKSRKGPAHFGYGSGTLQGHLLAGEERFLIELDGNGKVWYEITSFSKPAHFLSFLGYPYVKLRQKHFARHSSEAVLKHLNAS